MNGTSSLCRKSSTPFPPGHGEHFIGISIARNRASRTLKNFFGECLGVSRPHPTTNAPFTFKVHHESSIKQQQKLRNRNITRCCSSAGLCPPLAVRCKHSHSFFLRQRRMAWRSNILCNQRVFDIPERKPVPIGNIRDTPFLQNIPSLFFLVLDFLHHIGRFDIKAHRGKEPLDTPSIPSALFP